MNDAFLDGRRAVVTGGTRGIGLAITRRLALAGAEVHAVYRSNHEAALDAIEYLQKEGLQVTLHQGDVSEPDFVAEVFKQMKALGGVDVLVNNAGVTDDQLFLRMKFEQWANVVRTNLDSVFLCSQAAAKQMMRKEWGRIVNLASPSAYIGNIGQANYTASKGGVLSLTKTVAKEVARYNITCNTVSPGFTDTEMTAALADEAKQQILAEIPSQRSVKPDEVAKAVLFLCSDAAGYMTGSTIDVNGGLVMR